jgi:hypothetical protein
MRGNEGCCLSVNLLLAWLYVAVTAQPLCRPRPPHRRSEYSNDNFYPWHATSHKEPHGKACSVLFAGCYECWERFGSGHSSAIGPACPRRRRLLLRVLQSMRPGPVTATIDQLVALAGCRSRQLRNQVLRSQRGTVPALAIALEVTSHIVSHSKPNPARVVVTRISSVLAHLSQALYVLYIRTT